MSRDDANAATLLYLPRTLGPSPDALFKRCQYCWIVQFNEREDFVEIAQRFVGIDDFHARRCLAKTASTSSSVAKRPSRAALRPRSIPASSSGVARYLPPLR